jgi:hypothetical protein
MNGDTEKPVELVVLRGAQTLIIWQEAIDLIYRLYPKNLIPEK